MKLAELLAHGFGKLSAAQRVAGATNVLAVTSTSDIVYPDGTSSINSSPEIQKLNEGINYATDLAGHAAQYSTSASANVVNILGAVQYAVDIAGKAASDALTLKTATKTATSIGSPGNVAFDGTNLYVCVATNSWKKLVLETI